MLISSNSSDITENPQDQIKTFMDYESCVLVHQGNSGCISLPSQQG